MPLCTLIRPSSIWKKRLHMSRVRLAEIRHAVDAAFGSLSLDCKGLIRTAVSRYALALPEVHGNLLAGVRITGANISTSRRSDLIALLLPGREGFLVRATRTTGLRMRSRRSSYMAASLRLDLMAATCRHESRGAILAISRISSATWRGVCRPTFSPQAWRSITARR